MKQPPAVKTAAAPRAERPRSRPPLGGARLRLLVRERSVVVPERTRRTAEAVTFVAIAVLLLIFFRPGLLLSETTATGGDTGAHVFTPWYLKTHLLPSGRIAGWSHDWYAGFPVLHFYFPLVVTVQALLAFLIPYEVAFKIGTVLGTFFFPVAIYLFFRLARFRFPVPVVGALFSLVFLFMDSFQIYGGNIPSTLAGEYSFSLSLGLVFVFLGLGYRIATEQHGRPLVAAGVLALAALSHLVPVMMVVLSAPLLIYWAARTHGPRVGVLRLAGPFGLAFAMTAFWSVPFLVRLPYAADMHWFRLEGLAPLVPRELWFFLGAAAVAVLVAVLRRDGRVLLFLVPAAVGVAFYFVVSPGLLFDGRVWNGRFLPFWYLGAILATAYLLGSVLPTVARFTSRRHAGAVALTLVAAIGAVTVGSILRDKGPSYIDDWIAHNYAGYEAQAAFPTFEALMDHLEGLPSGRVLWEPSPGLGQFGTPVAPMTIPYWTGQPTMEGIYFESSFTTPFHFVTVAEVAEQPSNPIPNLPYHGFDMERGLRHMQLLGVSYFVSFSDQAREAAVETAGLERVADVGTFTIFRVDESGQVIVPRYEPVVLSDGDWIDTNLTWFGMLDALDVPLVRDGPSGWARVSSLDDALPRRPVEGGGAPLPARFGDQEVTFTTTAIGKPHWVKTSYFPNWTVEGAHGPYLASPSMMMVVPTQSEVRLQFTRTWAEWTGLALTLAALMLVAVPPLRRWTREKAGA